MMMMTSLRNSKIEKEMSGNMNIGSSRIGLWHGWEEFNCRKRVVLLELFNFAFAAGCLLLHGWNKRSIE
jgi:hypothetical protein